MWASSSTWPGRRRAAPPAAGSRAPGRAPPPGRGTLRQEVHCTVLAAPCVFTCQQQVSSVSVRPAALPPLLQHLGDPLGLGELRGGRDVLRLDQLHVLNSSKVKPSPPASPAPPGSAPSTCRRGSSLTDPPSQLSEIDKVRNY